MADLLLMIPANKIHGRCKMKQIDNIFTDVVYNTFVYVYNQRHDEIARPTAGWFIELENMVDYPIVSGQMNELENVIEKAEQELTFETDYDNKSLDGMAGVPCLITHTGLLYRTSTVVFTVTKGRYFPTYEEYKEYDPAFDLDCHRI